MNPYASLVHKGSMEMKSVLPSALNVNREHFKHQLEVINALPVSSVFTNHHQEQANVLNVRRVATVIHHCPARVASHLVHKAHLMIDLAKAMSLHVFHVQKARMVTRRAFKNVPNVHFNLIVWRVAICATFVAKISI